MNGMASLSVRRGCGFLQCRSGWRQLTTPQVARSTFAGSAMRVWQCSDSAADHAPFHATGRIWPEQGGRDPLVGLVGRLVEYRVHHGRPDARGKDGINVLHGHNRHLLYGLLRIARSLWLGRI